MTTATPDAPIATTVSESAVRTEILNVSPKTAEFWLLMNKQNRPVRQRVVHGFANDMKAGKWLLTGEAVKFDTEGNLVDGQHRLTAIVQSGATVPLTVVYGVSPDVKPVLDSGTSRTVGDALSISGISANIGALAAATRLAVLWDKGDFNIERAKDIATRTEVLNYINENPDITESVALARAMSQRCDLRASVLAFCIFLTRRVDAEASAEFFERLCDGVGLEVGNPILALRNRLQQARRHRERIEPIALTSVTLRAWNAWRTGESLRHLQTASRYGSLKTPTPV